MAMDMTGAFAYAYRRFYEGANYRLRTVAGGRWASYCRPVTPTLMLTERCNAACVHCDIWRNRGKENCPTVDQWRKVVWDLRRWLGPVHVVFTGGEPLLKPFTPDVVAYASSLGLFVEVLTHGYWRDQSKIEKLVAASPWRVTVSLDGVGDVHSRIRGREHFFDKTRETLHTLQRLRREKSPNMVILLKTVIMSHNIDSVCDIAHFAREEGMEVFYQPIEQNYNTPDDPEWFRHSDNWPHDSEKAVAAVNKLIELKKKGFPIRNSSAQLEVMIPYFRDPDAMRVAVQYHGAHERRAMCSALISLQIQADGAVTNCVGKDPIGNIKHASIREIWENRPRVWEDGCCLFDRCTDAEKRSLSLSVRSRSSQPEKTVLSVLALDPLRIGGQEAFIRELSSQLDHYGWRSVVCFSKEPPENVRRYLSLPNVQLEVLPDLGSGTFKNIPGLVRLLRKYRPTIAHMHFTGFVSPYPWLARAFSVQKVFYTDHSSRPALHVPQRAPFWKRRLGRVILWPLTKVICVSEYGYRSNTAVDMLPPERFHVIYNGVDFSRIAVGPGRAEVFRRKYSIPEDVPLVLQVSWLIPEKGVTDLLHAARQVVSHDPNVHFVVAGEGPCQDEYVRLAEELGIKDHVVFTGMVEDPVGEGIYSAADVVCQLSRWEESFGFVIAEAMAFGKPVIGTRVGGIPELIQDGETGFLVPRADADRIADRILLLVRDKAMRERMGGAGRQAANAKFDLQRNVSQLLNIYGVR